MAPIDEPVSHISCVNCLGIILEAGRLHPFRRSAGALVSAIGRAAGQYLHGDESVFVRRFGETAVTSTRLRESISHGQ